MFGKIFIEEANIEHHLKKTIKLKEIYQQILYQKIIAHAAKERNLIVAPEEIQAEADRQRHEYHLEKATDTLAWLAEQMITADDWEEGIRDRLLADKLATSLFAQGIEAFFIQNKINFEQVLLYQIVVPYEQLAWEIFYQIEEEEMSFYQAAHLYDIDEKRRYSCGYEGHLCRWNLSPDIAALVFGAKPGECLLPFHTELGYHLFMVEEFIASELTPEIYQNILNNMFDEWLERELNYSLHQPQDNF